MTEGLWSRKKTTYRIKVQGYQEGREITGKTLQEVKREIANNDFLFDKTVYVLKGSAIMCIKNPYRVTFTKGL